MKQKKDYFTTGEFARICGVRKQTLFYYDSIGIFSPEIVGDNGYRYYSYTQVETFAVLTMTMRYCANVFVRRCLTEEFLHLLGKA